MRKVRATTWIWAMSKQDLAAVWTVLESAPPDAGVEAVGTGYEVVAGELLAGVDGDGRRYLLIPLLAGEAARVDTKGRAVHLIRLQHGGAHYLAVACVARELYSVFTQFTRELVSSVEAADSPARAAAEAFERWRALFSEATLRGVLSEERLIGLLGELLTLESLLIKNAPRDLGYWTGPLGEAQDFRTGTHAVEVKSTLAREGRIISIASIDQLQPPPAAELCLIHHRLDRDPNGFNIADMIDRLTSSGAARRALAAGLRENDVNIDDLKIYGGRRYREVESRTYDVQSFAFPKITRGSFKGGDTPPGTLRISYSIDLTNEPPTPLSANGADDFIKAMAEEAARGMGS
jgi:hypothetical protein